MKKTFLFVLFFLLSNLVFSADSEVFPNPNLFPLPAGYKPNVDFWMKVYGEWEEDEMVIHDSLHMDVVFDVVEIPEENELLRTVAKEKVKSRVDEIKRVLLDLHTNPQSQKNSDDHQKIFDLYKHIAGSGKFQQAAENIRVQQGIKERFERGLEQMTLYLDQIKRVMREEGLPEEIGYLPLVESSFNNQSLSKTRAAGIWQFMPGTARLYMKVNSDVDERLDPSVATRGAAKYLKRSYQLFGNWPVSLMSYNHGQQGMINATRALGTKDFMPIVKNYTGKYFGFASRNFYGEFLAACKVMKDAEKYFGKIDYEKPLRYDSVRLSKPLYISAIQKGSSLSREEIRAYNPALQSTVLFSRRPIPTGYNLHLPAGKFENPVTFIASLRGTSTSEKQTVSKTTTTTVAKKNPTVTSSTTANAKTYVVKRGDTLFSISRKFSVSVDALRRFNDLTHNVIRPGQSCSLNLNYMPLASTEAFVLRSYKLAEQDKIVVLFTRDYGKLRFVAKGARRLRNRFGASLEVFTHVRIQFHEKENRELLVLDRADILYSPFEKQTKLRASYYLFYFAELIHEFYPDREKSVEGFRILLNIEKAFQKQQNLDFLARYVELQLLHSQGILSSVASCSECNRRFESLQEKRYLGSNTEIFCKRCRSIEHAALSTRIVKSIDAFERGSADWVTTVAGSVMEELASWNHLLITRFLGKELNSYRLRKHMV